MLLLKIGSGESINLSGIARDLATIEEKAVVVHGANGLRDQLGGKLGWEKKVVTSLAGVESVYSDSITLDLIIMAYAGLRNKRIVETFLQNGIKAIGLSGIDGALITGRRNRGIKVKENNRIRILRDLSGKPVGVNIELLSLLLGKGYTPVITVPILDEKNTAINSDNDDIIYLLHTNFPSATVIFLIEAPGLLLRKEDPNSLIPYLSLKDLEDLERKSEGRIRRKLIAIRKIVSKGGMAIVADGRKENPVLEALIGKGTVIKNESI